MPADRPLEARVRARLTDLARLRPASDACAHPSGSTSPPTTTSGCPSHPRVTAAFVAGIERGGVRQHRVAAAARRARCLCGRRAAVRRVQGDRAVAVLLVRLPRQPRRADDAAGGGRRHLLRRAATTPASSTASRLSRAEARHLSAQRRRRRSRACSRRRPVRGHRFVVVESLFSMDGDEAPLAEYARICREHRRHADRGRGARRRRLRRARHAA